MKHSPLRTPLAILRTELGLSQEELGKLVGKARRTIQAIELGKLRLTEELALRVSNETGVSARWLLEGNPETAIHSAEGFGSRTYRKEIFEEIQAGNKAGHEMGLEIILPKTTPARLHLTAVSNCARWFPILAAAKKSGKQEVAVYLLHKFFDEMEQRFGSDFAPAEKINRKAKLKTADGEEYAFVFEEGDCSLSRTKGETGIKIRYGKKEDPKK